MQNTAATTARTTDLSWVRAEARERGKAAANALKVARRNEARLDAWMAR